MIFNYPAGYGPGDSPQFTNVDAKGSINFGSSSAPQASNGYIEADSNYIYITSAPGGENAAQWRMLKSSGNIHFRLWDSANSAWGAWDTTLFYNASIERTANTVLAAPNGSNGVGSFRQLVTRDISDLGSWLNSDITTAKSFSHNTFTTLTSLTLSRGVWIMTWGLVFAANSTGVRMGCITTDETTGFNSTSGRRTNGERVPACSAGETIIHGSFPTRVDTNTTVYLRGAHTAGSGTSLSVTGNLRAIKVGYY